MLKFHPASNSILGLRFAPRFRPSGILLYRLSCLACVSAGSVTESIRRLCSTTPRRTMKRSRTCQCLVELDTPKRTRSTPDLGALQRRRAVFGSQQNFLDSSPAMIATSHAGLDAAMRLFQQPVSSSGISVVHGMIEVVSARSGD